ncbi:hypothetical protein [Micromonospora sp. NBC_01796]|uniref:hypothetical protein n=1 Tax=Micromonospora sp. NBC_01796 TaxID=2975987 RepID=UPI002DDA8F46|nr:hypothetical protein [Micromonospora sp. NBC_01796]WSA83554.1 hypothetical protein OIE47_24565 [Micromonospora sp. NBC_01796]
MSIRWRIVAGLAVLTVLAVGCERPTAEDPEHVDGPVRPGWHALRLPMPAGAAGRLVLRDTATCAGRWYIAGAVADAAGETRPAVWTSTDALTWSSVELTAKTYYGRQNVLSVVACRDGRVAAIGAKSGGAHANPRVSTWRQNPDGTLTEVIAPFELYGGPQAVNVARVVAGPAGWMIVGNRMSGAAAWTSADAARFEIVEAAPELASDARGETWAFDVLPLGDRWLVVGGVILTGRIDRDPLAWTSTDGRTWRRLSVPADDGYEEMQRVVLVGGVPVALGLSGDGFGVWRGGAGPDSDGWTAVGRFGSRSTHGVPAVRGLAATGDRLFAATSDGVGHGLWTSADSGRSWRPIAAPTALPGGAERQVAVSAGADRLLVVADDGVGGSAWWTAVPLDGA